MQLCIQLVEVICHLAFIMLYQLSPHPFIIKIHLNSSFTASTNEINFKSFTSKPLNFLLSKVIQLRIFSHSIVENEGSDTFFHGPLENVTITFVIFTYSWRKMKHMEVKKEQNRKKISSLIRYGFLFSEL